jgi:transposase
LSPLQRRWFISWENLAERVLRGAVVWRRKCFGNASERGLRYVERVLSVIQTLRRRGRDVLEYLTAAGHTP